MFFLIFLAAAPLWAAARVDADPNGALPSLVVALPAPSAALGAAPAAGLPALTQVLAMAKPTDSSSPAQGQSPESEGQSLRQAFDGSGGPGAPGDPSGGGVPAGLVPKERKPRLLKPSQVRTRDQFAKFLFDHGAPEDVAARLTRGVVDEILVRGNGVGERFAGEEAVVRGAIKTIGEWRTQEEDRRRIEEGDYSRLTLRAFLGAIARRLAEGEPVAARFYGRTLFEVLRQRTHEDFSKHPAYNRGSVDDWFSRNEKWIAELSLEEISGPIAELFEERALTIARIRKDLSARQTKRLLESEVDSLTLNHLSETAALRALRRVFDESKVIYDNFDERRGVRLFTEVGAVIRYETKRDTVIEELTRHNRYDRDRLLRWFQRHRGDDYLRHEMIDDLLARIKVSLARGRHR